jgi:hypothetical protein
VIPGFNLDIKHKGKTFHIQTEDSGPANPVIMTHLFLFGTILGTRRLEYADAVTRSDLPEHVRELMRQELKEMHKSLLAGDFDELARRPQKKLGGDIPLARKTGNQGPTIPPAQGAPPASTAPPPAAPVAFDDETTALVRRPSGDLGIRVIEPLATMDADELLDESDLAESVNEHEAEAEAELTGDDLVSVIEEPAGRPQTSPIDRTTFPNMLPRAATPVRAPRAGVEFPTDLVAETRFDDVILAWLLEDVDEP